MRIRNKFQQEVKILPKTKKTNQNVPAKDFTVVMASEPEKDTVLLTSAEIGEEWLRRAMASYDPANKMYTAYLGETGKANTITQDLLETLGENAQSDLDKIKQINNIIRKYINIDDLLGMVYQSIYNNINTEFRLSYKNFGEQRNKTKVLVKTKALIDDFNTQVNLKQFIRDAITTCYAEGNFICTLRNDDVNWTIDNLPLGIAEISGYTEHNNPVVLINISNLSDALKKTALKTKKGKVLFFKDTLDEIKNTYSDEVYQAAKNKETYARLDTAYTGVVRINNMGRKYGLSPMFRALSPTLMLSSFASADESTSQARAKKIIHQVLREKVLGDKGDNPGWDEMTYAHSNFMKAFTQSTVVITTPPAVDRIEYVEPKVSDVNVEKINLYRNKVLSSLGVAFLANDKSQTASTAIISLQQLLQCINSISEQVETVIENFYRTLLTANNIGLEYVPSVSIIDSELLDMNLRIELSKLLYTTFNGSMETSLSMIGVDIEDEKSKREQENADGLEGIFTPRVTAYTNSGGRPADDDPNNPDKQIEDKLYNDNARG